MKATAAGAFAGSGAIVVRPVFDGPPTDEPRLYMAFPPVVADVPRRVGTVVAATITPR